MKTNKRNYAVGLAAVIAVSVVLVSCGDSSSSSSEPAVPRQSAAVLENYLKTGLNQSGQMMRMQPAPVAAIAEDSAGASESFSATSETNTQEVGVDELNWLKNDKEYIFAYSNGPSQEGTPLAASVSDEDIRPVFSRQVKVYQMDGAQPAAPLVNSVALQDNVSGLYLSDKNELGRAEQLVVVSEGSFEGAVSAGVGLWDYWAWRQQAVNVRLYDIANPAEQIDSIAELTLEGTLVSSRRIGDQLYIVSRFTPYVSGFKPYPYSEQQVTANKALLDGLELQDLLPRIRINGEVQPLATAENCFVPESASEGSPSLLTVTAINLKDSSAFKVSCIAAYAATVYASTDNVYVVASSSRANEIFWMWDDFVGREITSTIHRFELSSNGPIYRGEGAVRGEVGWDKQFRLSEYDGHLRVVTSAYGDYLNLGSNFENDFTHSIHTLAIENDHLRAVATLPNEAHPKRIGKPGEKLYSARFFKDKAYLVTFKKVDPFYVIDLSDAAQPQLLGELEMPGYSSYLQPIGDDLILGIGKDAKGGDGTFAWFQGVKIGLFDVSSPTEPVLVNEYILGKRGTSSAAEYDHKAITLLKSDQGGQWRVALPVVIHDKESNYSWGYDSDSEYYEWSYNGLFLFDITTADHANGVALTQQGVMVSARANQQNPYPNYWGSHSGSVLSADTVHYFDGSSLWSADWNQLDDLTGPQ